MTEQERKLCLDLVITPWHPTGRISKEEFLCRFPAAVEGGSLALKLLADAYNAQNAEDLGCALIVGHVFGFAAEHTDTLCHLVEVDWHYSHEDVVSALDVLRTPTVVEALFRATQWIPKSLEYDDSRALARKAIWALGKINGSEAEMKLEVLARSNDAIVQETALEQLDRRRRAI